jgi:alkylhydroperoxidase family enzyme
MDIRHAVGVKAGIPVTKLDALTEWQTSPEFSERERASLAFAAEIVGEGTTVSERCFERVRAHFTEPEIVELTFIVGYQTFASKFAKALDLAPQGFAG